MSGVDKIPMQDEYENVLKGDMDLKERNIKIGELNELAYNNSISSFNTSFSIGKVAFGLVQIQRV